MISLLGCLSCATLATTYFSWYFLRSCRPQRHLAYRVLSIKLGKILLSASLRAAVKATYGNRKGELSPVESRKIPSQPRQDTYLDFVVEQPREKGSHSLQLHVHEVLLGNIVSANAALKHLDDVVIAVLIDYGAVGQADPPSSKRTLPNAYRLHNTCLGLRRKKV